MACRLRVQRENGADSKVEQIDFLLQKARDNAEALCKPLLDRRNECEKILSVEHFCLLVNFSGCNFLTIGDICPPALSVSFPSTGTESPCALIEYIGLHFNFCCKGSIKSNIKEGNYEKVRSVCEF